MTSLQIVEESANYNCDSNQDGEINDDDGTFNQFLLGATVSNLLKVNPTLAESIEDGTLLFLGELANYTGEDTEEAALNMYLGSALETQPDPTCGVMDKISDMCDWNIAPTSFDGDCNPIVAIHDAKVAGGELSGGPQDFTFTFDLSGIALGLKVQQGSVNGTVSGNFTYEGGRLCGSIAKDDVTGAIKSACDSGNVPDSMQLLCGFVDTIGALITTCKKDDKFGGKEMCTIVISMDGVPGKLAGLGE
jgi:hypothetical protein